MHGTQNDTGIPIERLTVSTYCIPTDFPEAEGVFPAPRCAVWASVNVGERA